MHGHVPRIFDMNPYIHTSITCFDNEGFLNISLVVKCKLARRVNCIRDIADMEFLPRRKKLESKLVFSAGNLRVCGQSSCS